MQQLQVCQNKNKYAFKINQVDPTVTLDKCYLHVEGNKRLNEISLIDLQISKTLNSYDPATINMLREKKGWVIIPGYLNSNKSGKIILSDIQLAVTGKCKEGESYINAVKREIKEELGFDIADEDIDAPLKSVKGSNNFNKSDVYPCVISPSTITPSINQTTTESTETTDDYYRRIQSWFIVDDPKDRLILNRVRSNTSDKAGEIIAIVSVEQLLKVLEIFVQQASILSKL